MTPPIPKWIDGHRNALRLLPEETHLFGTESLFGASALRAPAEIFHDPRTTALARRSCATLWTLMPGWREEAWIGGAPFHAAR